MGIDYILVGFRIRQRRKEMNLTQEALGNLVGISSSHLSAIERGEKNPSLDTLLLICTSLEISVDYLLSGTVHTDIDSDIINKIKICSLENRRRIYKIIDVFIEEEKVAK